MSIMTGVLRRHLDPSNVSGTGDVAEFCEFSDGAVAVRWPGDHPSTAAWNDIRDVEFIHGHQGATEIVPVESERLLAAYQRVMPFLLSVEPRKPLLAAPHPDHPDRLRLVFDTTGVAWAFWVALLEGSTHAAVHEEINGETEHRWVSADGDVWCVYYSPLSSDDPLTTFDKEDR